MHRTNGEKNECAAVDQKRSQLIIKNNLSFMFFRTIQGVYRVVYKVVYRVVYRGVHRGVYRGVHIVVYRGVHRVV